MLRQAIDTALDWAKACFTRESRALAFLGALGVGEAGEALAAQDTSPRNWEARPAAAAEPFAAMTLPPCVSPGADSLVSQPVVPWQIPFGSRVIATVYDPGDPSEPMNEVAVKLHADMTKLSSWTIDVTYDWNDDGLIDGQSRVLDATQGAMGIAANRPITLSQYATTELNPSGSTGTAAAQCYQAGSGFPVGVSGFPRGGVLRLVVTDTQNDGITGTVDRAAWYVRPPATVGVDDQPAASRPLRVWPNPSRGAAQINFSLSEPEEVQVKIVDVSGRAVRDVAHGHLQAGAHTYGWDGRDNDGAWVPAGVYYCKVSTESGVQGRRIVVLGR